MQTEYADGQMNFCDLDSWDGKMFSVLFPPDAPRARTSGSSSKRSHGSSAVPFMSLDLTPGAGNLLGESYWELCSPSLGGSSMRNTGECPREEKGSTLSQILEEHPPKKYYLTAAACKGILRRAEERGKPLPQALDTALRIQAGMMCLPEGREKTVPFDDSAVLAQPGMKQQTFAASFSAGASATAGTIGYAEEVAPTLKGSPSGNCMPSVMCLHDQGGQRMDVCENMTGTLRASEKGHQPLVYENHGIDARVRESGEISPTVTARYGTGGGNTPLVQEDSDVYCIVGNIIDRQPENGGNGAGYQKDLSYTLTSMDRHAIFARQRVDEFKNDEIASTQSARQAKDATDLVVEPDRQYAQLIRRLTPLECERLQGFPDDWTNIPGASDSARYRALGNSVAIPCVEFIMKSLREVTELETEQSQVQGDHHAEK